ncbi:MAG: extracellular solute-binding protein [Christensenellaceae bacterium]
MRKLHKIAAILLVVVMVGALGALTACGGIDKNTVDFWVKGTESEVAAYKAMVETFNATYGAEHGIKARLTSKSPGAYDTTIAATVSTESGPDVFLENEDNFKKDIGAGLIGEITDELSAVTDADLSDIYPNVMSRYRYDPQTNTSNEGDPVYGLPLDTRPSALYYNETLFRQAGILVISVDESDLEAFWNGNKADNRGLTKADYITQYEQMQRDGLVSSSAVNKLKNLTKLPNKGYYRERPCYGGAPWSQPNSSEVLIFNNRIAMNWDEAEDLARLFTKGDCTLLNQYKNNKGELLTSTTNGTVEYGMFTEWWFMYAWSVGGDCLLDLTGSGDWNFSLLDPTPNYIVADGKTFVGAYTGKTYAAGETVEFLDKMDVAQGETLLPQDDGTYKHAGGAKAVVRTEIANSDALIELPSTRKAFERYIRLGSAKTADINGSKGTGIAPNPNLFASRKNYNYFFSGKLAMLAEYSIYMPSISEYMAQYGFDYDIAPLLVYKEYANPSVATDDSVKVKGQTAGQSNSMGMVVRKCSKKKDKAAAFVAWMASAEGQAVKAEYGFFPNQVDLVKDMKFASGVAPKNISLFSENMTYQTAGDWWYLEDYEWINTWAQDLNSYVRNGTMAYNTWADAVVTKTNNKLASY